MIFVAGFFIRIRKSLIVADGDRMGVRYDPKRIFNKRSVISVEIKVYPIICLYSSVIVRVPPSLPKVGKAAQGEHPLYPSF
jgi:hypothetical protein